MQLGLASVVAVFALCAPALGITALSVDDPSLQGMTLASGTVPIPTAFFEYGGSDDSTPQLLVDEKVVRNAAGVLDFYYKVRNPPGAANLLHTFDINFPAGKDLQISLDYLDEGNLAPATADTGPGYPASTVDALYIFTTEYGALDGVPLPDAGSDFLVVRTNATGYVNGTIYAGRQHDDFIGNAQGFVPDANSVPEPHGLALLALSVVGLAVKFRRY